MSWRAAFAAAAMGLLFPLLPATTHAAGGGWSRITYYVERGYTASGAWTIPGWTAACSYDLPLGTLITVDGDEYVCADRGRLGSGSPRTWIDLSGGEWVTARYGDYAEVEVVGYDWGCVYGPEEC